MPFAAALSHHPLATHAVGEAIGQILDAIGDRPDAVVLFVTGGFAGATEDIAGAVRATLRPGALIGATASTVLADGMAAESKPAVALFAMRFGPPRRFVDDSMAQAVAFDVAPARRPEVTASAAVDRGDGTLLVLSDPFSFPTETYLGQLRADRPGLVVAGGLASLGSSPGGNVLVADDRVAPQGAVGLLLPPGITTDVVVSQGCQPVGTPLVVTRSRGSMIEEIAGEPALDRLLAQAADEDPETRGRMARSLHLGLVLDEAKPSFAREDFLIRPVLGADKERGAISVGGEVPVGTTVQFQVRDGTSVGDDLRHSLRRSHGDAALVFTGSDRRDLTDDAHAEAGIVADELGGGASAGMVTSGEIGAVGSDHLVHASATTVVRFSEPSLS